MTKPLRVSRILLSTIFLGGLLLRVAFLLYGAKAYYGVASIHENGDSHSYMWAFENLWHTGYYTFDFLTPDAAFGRLPGYSFFYGLHYLVWGPKLAVAATAWTQVLLDSCGSLLMFGILRRLFPTAYAGPLLGALLYAFYPFTIIWLPMMGTEALSTTLTLLWLYYLLGFRPTAVYALGLGLLLAVLFYVREYLGILVPISVLYLLAHRGLSRQLAWRSAVLLGLGFGMLYAWWPVRNYVLHQRVILTKPKTAGYASYGADMDDFRSWVQCWTNDENPWIDQVLGTGTVVFPAEVFANAQEQANAQRLVRLTRQCGFSFYLTRTVMLYQPEYRDTLAMRRHAEYQARKRGNCAPQISVGFTQLRKSYQQRHPVAYFFQVPLQNLSKAFFKSNTAQASMEPVTGKMVAMRLLFGYRSLLVLLGVAGLLVFRHRRGLWPVALFFGFMYLFISFIMRGLEMRYLIQADAVLLVPASALLGLGLDALLRRMSFLPVAPMPEVP